MLINLSAFTKKEEEMFILNALYVLILFLNFSIMAENKNPKVVVIGAGLAGLTTAYRLQQKGVDVEVYEARNRVGGRVFTVNLNNENVELGGQNITDGGAAENLRRLMSEFNLELVEQKVDLNASYYDNETLISVRDIFQNRQFHPQELKRQLNELSMQCTNMAEVLERMFVANDPLRQIMAVRLACYEGGIVEKLSSLYTNTLYHILLGGICEAHPANALEDNKINIWSIKGGNVLLPEEMAAALGNKLHYNSPLTYVSKNNNGSFVLTCADKQVEADILVLANPCSTYQNIVFEKDIISEERLQLLQSVHYGTNAKILVPCRTLPAQRVIIENQCIAWFDFLGKAFTLYYAGKTSFFSSDTINDVYYQHGKKLVEMNFADESFVAIEPTCAQDQNFSVYQNAVGHSWPNDPYAKGSYSYIAPGQEKLLTSMIEVGGEMVKELFGPIDKILYFAGEHASILMDVPGTMEAACESGERTARMILNNIDNLG